MYAIKSYSCRNIFASNLFKFVAIPLLNDFKIIQITILRSNQNPIKITIYETNYHIGIGAFVG